MDLSDTPENERMSPEKGPNLKISSSNHLFSIVFRVVSILPFTSASTKYVAQLFFSLINHEPFFGESV